MVHCRLLQRLFAMTTTLIRRFIPLLYVIVSAACASTIPSEWGKQRTALLYQVTIQDDIGNYSPINLGLSLETKEGGINTRTGLSDRAKRRMYKALSVAIGEFCTVLPPLSPKDVLFNRLTDFPNYSLAEAQQLQKADLYAKLTGSLSARKVQVQVKGVAVQRLVPVFKGTIHVADARGKKVFRKTVKVVGDRKIGSGVDVGEWTFNKGMLVSEGEVIGLMEAAFTAMLTN